VEEMQKALDAFFLMYKTKRSLQGWNMKGRTPFNAFIDGLPKNEKEAQSVNKKAL
jgi:hypothetical protein